MKWIEASEFRTKCLEIVDEVLASGEPVEITKNGVIVARLIPAPQPKALFGAMKGSVVHMGDVISPIDENWEARQD